VTQRITQPSPKAKGTGPGRLLVSKTSNPVGSNFAEVTEVNRLVWST
jgi:hypothetical protein